MKFYSDMQLNFYLLALCKHYCVLKILRVYTNSKQTKPYFSNRNVSVSAGIANNQSALHPPNPHPTNPPPPHPPPNTVSCTAQTCRAEQAESGNLHLPAIVYKGLLEKDCVSHLTFQITNYHVPDTYNQQNTPCGFLGYLSNLLYFLISYLFVHLLV